MEKQTVIMRSSHCKLGVCLFEFAVAGWYWFTSPVTRIWQWRLGWGLLVLLINPARGLAGDLPEVLPLWTFRLPEVINSSRATPAIGNNGVVYLGTFYGLFLAISPGGKLLWSYDTHSEVKSSAAVGQDGTVYFGARNRCFYALTRDGRLKWSFTTGGWVDSSPALGADGTLYFGSLDGFFYALKPDGSLKWRYNVGSAVDSSPSIGADGIVYFGAHDGNFYALRPDGRKQWRFKTGGPVVSSPAIGQMGTVYFTSTDGNVYALDAGGRERWQYHTGSMTESSPVLDESGNIYLGGDHWSMESLSGDGKLRWRWPSPVLMDTTAATMDGRVYTSMPWGMLYAFKSTGSDPVWRTRTAFNLSSSPAIDAQGTIYFVCNLFLYAVHPMDRTGAAGGMKSSWPQFRGNACHTGRVGL